MADLITQPMGQAMAGQAQAGSDNLAQQATQAQQSQPVPQDQAAGSDTDPRPVGTQQDAQNAQLAQNGDSPMNRVPATPEEQAQYTQLVTRFVLMISDMRPGPNGKSPVDLALDQMNNPKLSVAQAVGYTTAQIIFILHNGAKSQKVQYDPDVLFHGADECIVATYLLGLARGIFKGMPPFKGLGDNQESYPFDPKEITVIAHAKLYAVQKFGKLMQRSGQISETEKQQAIDFWHQQVTREIKNHEVDDTVMEQLGKTPGLTQQLDQQNQPAQVQPQPTPQQPPAAPPQGGQ
jgi:hypothetical protein